MESNDRCYFFFNDTATTEIYTLSLHDALPIWPPEGRGRPGGRRRHGPRAQRHPGHPAGSGLNQQAVADRPSPKDRKSTRLNSSHANISYAVFCLKKKYSSHSPFLLSSPTSAYT